MVEGYVHEIKNFKVCLQTPSTDIVGVNTNGSAVDNLSNIGVCGICRNHRGELLFAYFIPIGTGINN